MAELSPFAEIAVLSQGQLLLLEQPTSVDWSMVGYGSLAPILDTEGPSQLQSSLWGRGNLCYDYITAPCLPSPVLLSSLPICSQSPSCPSLGLIAWEPDS